MSEKRTVRRRVFAGVGVLAGLVLVGFEMSGATGANGVERWFWLAVGLLLSGSARRN